MSLILREEHRLRVFENILLTFPPTSYMYSMRVLKIIRNSITLDANVSIKQQTYERYRLSAVVIAAYRKQTEQFIQEATSKYFILRRWVA
jgi:hypothetical protein